MKEIKFRLWNTVRKDMNYDGGMMMLGNSLIQDEHNILMQFTGLEDKNENEIYEGDMIEWDSGVKLICEWNEDNACFEFKEFYSPDENVHDIRIYRTDEQSKVIGNEYENPELFYALSLTSEGDKQ